MPEDRLRNFRHGAGVVGLLLGRIADENGNRIPFAVRHPHESRVVESDPFTPFVPVSRQPGREPVGFGRAGEHRPDDEVPILRCERIQRSTAFGPPK